jgi:hypothetical protein
MVINKSLDPYKQIIAAMLRDVQTIHGIVFTPRSLRLTIQKMEQRSEREGIGFLTKTLPRLAKCLDKALAEEITFNQASHGFKTMPSSELPRFLGELFERVFSHSGRILPTPCVRSIKVLRDILYLFYKLEVPCAPDDEQHVLDQFVKTEEEVRKWNSHWETFDHTHRPPATEVLRLRQWKVIHTAHQLLNRVFEHFDERDIQPRHGPGSVSTKEKLWAKYVWTNVSSRITSVYPLDEYYFVSMSHVCDRLEELNSLTTESRPARVILVPKDSRGPRLISCEPVDFQWIQQGLSRSVVHHVEGHPLTRCLINFTDQGPNRRAALLGSTRGEYATLDLKEASDRVSLGLVRLLFPERLVASLMACRSSETVLPDSTILSLHKHAPMGSALCFPVMALTVWALLNSAALHAYPSRDQFTSYEAEWTHERILVYGDDVIVPANFAARAISTLEMCGLKVNTDKSCTKGFFRESCGMDAYKGTPVTPTRIRTVWSTSPSPSAYTSWIAYANMMYKRGYYHAYDVIVRELNRTYGYIPTSDMRLACPSLDGTPHQTVPVPRRRNNKSLQKLQYYVTDVEPVKIRKKIDGWSMLLRFFAEAGSSPSVSSNHPQEQQEPEDLESSCFDASSYTKRSECKLVKRWR